jgi:hypothetical protein
MTSPSVAQNVEYWPIERLVEYPRNPRKNDGAVDRMCDSIRQFGFKIPVLTRSDGEIVDGHLRLKAARKLGITEVPVILCDDSKMKSLLGCSRRKTLPKGSRMKTPFRNYRRSQSARPATFGSSAITSC